MYLYARREVLEEEVIEPFASATIDVPKWPSIQPIALLSSGMSLSKYREPPFVSNVVLHSAVDTIVEATRNASFPLLIVAHSGRNPRTVSLLSEFSDLLNIAVHAACPSAVCIPSSHPNFLGTTFSGKNPFLAQADVIIVLDTDVPWIDMSPDVPRKGTRIFVIDPDPLKQTMGWSHVDAELICRADSEVAVSQLLEKVRNLPSDVHQDLRSRTHRQTLQEVHNQHSASLKALELLLKESGVATVPNILGILRQAVRDGTPSKGEGTLWLNEAITNYGLVFDHVMSDYPGSMLCSGGTSLGWALGAAVGAQLGALAIGKVHDLVVVIVGDGTFMFGVPSSAYWIARRCNTVRC